MDGDMRRTLQQITGGFAAIGVFTLVFALIVGPSNLSTLPVAAAWGAGSLVIGAVTVVIILVIQNVIEHKRQTEWERTRAESEGHPE